LASGFHCQTRLSALALFFNARRSFEVADNISNTHQASIHDWVEKSPFMVFFSAESEKYHFHFPPKILLLSQKVLEWLFAPREGKSVVFPSLMNP